MKILWLELAEEDINLIYQFYAENKSIKAAIKIYNEVLDAVDALGAFPQMGPIEWDLSEKGEEYRYLVIRKYFKVIYFVEPDAVYIAAVWDCRQSPQVNINKLDRE